MEDEDEFIYDCGMEVFCPNCNEEMEELSEDFEGMTEGQQADYDMGFNRLFGCPECGYHGLFDISPYDEWEDPEIDELVEISRIDPNSFEPVIENALKNKCFIEATSLIHNVIEAFLKRKLEDFFIEDSERFKLLKQKINFRYLWDYNSFCYILGLIKKEDYGEITKFNNDRNTAIHDLLKKVISLNELKLIARRGREIQMKLNPLNHTEQYIKDIMDTFDKITK